MGTISVNPMQTTGISGGFVKSTGGYVQGVVLDDPSMRTQWEGAFVGSSQSSPLWGGLPVTLAVPNVDSNAQGSGVISAGSLAAINAWTIFNQASAGIITPSSNVPLYTSGMSINIVRPGSLARICLPVANLTVLDALQAAEPNVSLYWDPTNLCLTTTSGGNYGPLPIQLMALSQSSKTVTYNSGTGAANWNNSGPAAIVRV